MSNKKRPGRATDRKASTVRRKNTARLRAKREADPAPIESINPSGDTTSDVTRTIEPLHPAQVAATQGQASGPEDEALAKLAEYRPMVIDLLLAMGMGTHDEPLELRRRVLTDLAKLGLRLPPVNTKPDAEASAETAGLEQRLAEHFERYQRALDQS